ncbi:MAG TPA: hypothetical protein VII58_05100 [Acidobacteriaceae bacterium]
MATQYVTQRFENSRAGLAQKDAYTKQMAAQGYRIVGEQLDAGHRKGGEQCCLFMICIPLVFLAGRTPGLILVTYGRDMVRCPSCGAEVVAAWQCANCLQLSADGQRRAALLAAQAKEASLTLERVLIDGTSGDYRFDWKSLTAPFQIAPPSLTAAPPPKRPPFVVRLVGRIPFVEKIIPWIRRRRLAWDELLQAEQNSRDAVVEQHSRALEDWKKAKEKFDREQVNDAEERCRLYEERNRAALFEYWARVLKSPVYGKPPRPPEIVAFDEAGHRLVLTCSLPPIDDLPKIVDVKHLGQIGEAVEVPLSEERRAELYRDLLMKIPLVVMYRLFQSDAADALHSIAFNGTLDTIDRAIGRQISPAVVAVQARKEEFMVMNFALLDVGACFERLQGTISGNFIAVTPVTPISE